MRTRELLLSLPRSPLAPTHAALSVGQPGLLQGPPPLEAGGLKGQGNPGFSWDRDRGQALGPLQLCLASPTLFLRTEAPPAPPWAISVERLPGFAVTGSPCLGSFLFLG